MILFFDTETTGLTPGHVIQLSYIMLKGEKVTAKNFYFSVPFVPPDAVAVHGLTAEKLKILSGERTFGEFLEEIDDDFRAADLTVAHNFAFDYKFMSAEFSYYERIFHYSESFDTMKKYTPLLKLPRVGGAGYKYPKLTELSEFFDLYPYDISRRSAELFKGGDLAHDARYDVTATFMAFMCAASVHPCTAEVLNEFM